MKCHICGSYSHLRNKCDQKQNGKSQGRTDHVQEHEAAQGPEIREVLDNGEEVELSESEAQSTSHMTEFHALDYCFFTDSAADTIIEHRPTCQCPCVPGACPRRPGQGCRRHCRRCDRWVGPVCCCMGDDVQLCHLCHGTEPDP